MARLGQAQEAIPAEAEATPTPAKKVVKKVIRVDRPEPEDDVFIHIQGNDTKVQYRHNGSMRTKMIASADLATALNTDLMLDTGILGISGHHYCGLKQYIKKGSAELIVQELSSGDRPMNFQWLGLDGENDRDDGVVTKNINCPYVIGIAKFVNGQMNDSWVYAARLPVINANTELYEFPYGNVYSGDSRVCWGSLSMRDLTKENFLTEFIQSNFNADLGFPFDNSGGDRGRRSINQILNNNESIPFDALLSKGRYSRVLETYTRRL